MMLTFGSMRADLCLSILASINAALLVAPPEFRSYGVYAAQNDYASLGIDTSVAERQSSHSYYPALVTSVGLFTFFAVADVLQRIASSAAVWAEHRRGVVLLWPLALWYPFYLLYIASSVGQRFQRLAETAFLGEDVAS